MVLNWHQERFNVTTFRAKLPSIEKTLIISDNASIENLVSKIYMNYEYCIQLIILPNKNAEYIAGVRIPSDHPVYRASFADLCNKFIINVKGGTPTGIWRKDKPGWWLNLNTLSHEFDTLNNIEIELKRLINQLINIR